MIAGTLALFVVLGFLYYLQKIHVSFNKRVFIGLLLGAVVGISAQILLDEQTRKSVVNIYNVVSVGYVRALQMIIYPIVIIATIRAFTKISNDAKVARTLGTIIFILLSTTAVAAVIGIFVTLVFGLNFNALSNIVADQNVINSIATRGNIFEKPFYVFITDFITTNPFADFTGARGNSIAASVIFSIIVGVAYLGVRRKDAAIADKFQSGVEVLYKIVMRIVVLVLRLTPYGIFAIIYKVVSTSNLKEILELVNFVGVSYIAIAIMFVIHSIMLMLFNFNIFTYYKKMFPLLTFAFASRSSASAIPINISTQNKQLGVNESVATSGASFGAILGQNGCAGIYPAMLAVAMAPAVGINPLDIGFILTLVGVIVISSFGIAGVGGGATFAAIAVLSSFNMPLTIVALLISVEPIIDMARTALNVNGSVVSSLISAKIHKELDMNTYNNLETLKDNQEI